MSISSEYLAGYFDGEGCVRITHTKQNRGFGIHVFITNTYLPTLQSLEEKCGGRVSLRNTKTETHRTIYQWRISNKKEALSFLLSIYPFLVEKKQQAAFAIEFCQLKDIRANRYSKGDPEVRARKFKLMELIKVYKKIDYGIEQ